MAGGLGKDLRMSMADAVKLKDGGDRRGENGGTGNAVASAFERFGEMPRRWRTFLHEVRVEMRQVTWPTRREVIVTTWVVMVTVAFFGVFFFGVDSGVSWLVQRVIKYFGH
jgi:preprotein translocase subunit SecE